jgi:hydrogenase maturation protease
VPDFDRSPSRSPITIIGLGNEFLSDDGAGIRVVRGLKVKLGTGAVRFEEQPVGGLALLDCLSGCDQCIIVDAIVTGTHQPGTMFRFLQTADMQPATLTSSHQIDLAQVLTLASMLGAELPRKLTVYGIEAEDVTTFHDGCTEDVSRAVPELVEIISRDLLSDDTESPELPGRWHIVNNAVPDSITTERT